MNKAKKIAGHDLVVLVIDAAEGFDKVMFRWCQRCGLVLTSFRPRWEASPVYLVPGAVDVLRGGGHWGRHQQPGCALGTAIGWVVAS